MSQIQCLIIANTGAVIHDGSVCETGDVITCDEADAARLLERGLATIVEGDVKEARTRGRKKKDTDSTDASADTSADAQGEQQSEPTSEASAEEQASEPWEE